MSSWTVIYRAAWVALALIVTVALLKFFSPKWREYREYQRKELEAQDRIKKEETQLQIYRTNQERFQTDSQFVERIAHEIGMARPGETIFKFQEDAAPLTVATGRLPAAAPAAIPSKPATNRPPAAAGRPRR